MACVPAPACQAALNEATRRWPGRNNASDGICASPDHRRRSPVSDHNDGTAFDLTHDPARGVDCHRLSVLVMRDPRVKYVIWNRRIGSQGRGWHDYRGANPHTQHMHVSINQSARKDVSSWFAAQQDEEDDLKDDERKMLKELHAVMVEGKTSQPPGDGWMMGDLYARFITVYNRVEKIARKLKIRLD